MASMASQLIQQVTAHARSESLEDTRETCTDGTYFPNKLRTTKAVWCKNEVIFELFGLFGRDEGVHYR